MKITSFFDFKGKELNTQIEIAKELQLDTILLRYVDAKQINDLTKEDILKVNGTLRSQKVNIAAIDPLIMSYDLYNLEAYHLMFKQYEKAMLQAKALKVSNMYFRLPIVNDIINEFETVERQITPIIDLAVKHNINLLIAQGKNQTNVITYIIKYYKNKRLSIIFNPKELSKNKESITASYRLLKKYITFFTANDIDKKNNPVLLGYGRLKIIDLFKKLKRDKYKDYIILDDAFKDFFIDKPIEKVSIFKRLFKSKNKETNDYLASYASKIFPDEKDRKVDLKDILNNQIEVLNIIFKSR